jgi:hypothetical protein
MGESRSLASFDINPLSIGYDSVFILYFPAEPGCLARVLESYYGLSVVLQLKDDSGLDETLSVAALTRQSLSLSISFNVDHMCPSSFTGILPPPFSSSRDGSSKGWPLVQLLFFGNPSSPPLGCGFIPPNKNTSWSRKQRALENLAPQPVAQPVGGGGLVGGGGVLVGGGGVLGGGGGAAGFGGGVERN